MVSRGVHRALIRQALHFALVSLLGEQSLKVLEFHLNRVLGGNLYDVFYDDPRRFYEAVKSFFGSGADSVIELVASKLLEDGYLDANGPQEFLELVIKGDEESKRRLRNMFKLSGGGQNG